MTSLETICFCVWTANPAGFPVMPKDSLSIDKHLDRWSQVEHKRDQSLSIIIWDDRAGLIKIAHVRASERETAQAAANYCK
jgi:hypothetical protein